ncbi:MAG: CBS domain-containing protein [Proteobacteria bacterium]|nr:CBS domain-containing protein [Pseudomonadota bacterium]
MRVHDIMSRNIRIARPDDSIEEAARMMIELDAGFLPVGQDDRLVGTITDRDIAIRGVGQGKGCDTTVDEIMSHDVKYCFDDQEIDEIADNMGDIQVRRLPVVNRDKRLVGVISLSDIAKRKEPEAGVALSDITRDSMQHNQII